MIPPIVGPGWLTAHADAVLADVRWYPDGRDPVAAFEASHLPGARFVDLDRCLAGPPTPQSGRHPLPEPTAFAESLRAVGIGAGVPVVGYDDAGGVLAARLVWMLRAWGCDAALLDGGLQGWPGSFASGPPSRRDAGESRIEARPWPGGLLAEIGDVDRIAAGGGDGVLLDARPADRYAGAPDTLDPRAGHIPGARSLPCREHLDAGGMLLPADELRARLDAVGAGEGVPVISSCGSGVTACHTLLVLEHLGRPPGRLYPGSWSQWSRTERLIATGP